MRHSLRTLFISSRFTSVPLCLLWLFISSCGHPADSHKTWQLSAFDPSSSKTHAIVEKDINHKLLLINYWAEWCKPCREEIPELNRFAAAHADTVIVLGYNFDNLKEDALQTAVNKMGISFPVLINNPAKTFTLPDIDGLPTTLLLDEHGILKEQLAGPQTLASLEAVLRKDK